MIGDKFSTVTPESWELFLATMDLNRTSIHPCGNGQDGLWWGIFYDDEMVANDSDINKCIEKFARWSVLGDEL